MMAYTKSSVTVVLELSEQEAKWLAEVVQNPLHDNETIFEQGVRESLWKALTEAMK